MISNPAKTAPFAFYLIENATVANEIINLVRDEPGFMLSGSQDNPHNALEEILKKERFPDAVIINIELCKAYQSNLPELITNHTALILTSQFQEDATLVYKYKAFDFLIRPIDLTQLTNCLNKIRSVKHSIPRHEPSDHFYIQTEMKGKMIRLNYDEVLYVEASQNYVIIHLEKKKYITYLTMKELEQKLSDASFLRIHKSYLVNESKIHSVDGDYVILKDNLFLKIGTSYKESLLSTLFPNFLISKRIGLRASK